VEEEEVEGEVLLHLVQVVVVELESMCDSIHQPSQDQD
jgi:hypothetical protein